MLTPAISASSTSSPRAIRSKASATQVRGPPFRYWFPLADATTTGFTLLGVRTVGPWALAGEAPAASTPAAAPAFTNSLRLTCLLMYPRSRDPPDSTLRMVSSIRRASSAGTSSPCRSLSQPGSAASAVTRLCISARHATLPSRLMAIHTTGDRFARLVLAAAALATFARPVTAGGLTSRANVVVLTGLPGDVESERAYEGDLRRLLTALDRAQARPQRVLVLADAPERVSLPAGLAGEAKAGSRDGFLRAAHDPAGTPRPLLVISLGP